MLFTAILLAQSGAPTPPLASFHPADALAYVEIPDLPALLAAYEQTSAMRMLADEEVRAPFAALLDEVGDLDFSAGAMLDELTARLGLVPVDLELLRKIEGLSISLRAERAAAGESVLREQLARIAAAIELHERTSGELPETLAALDGDLDETDPWGEPWIYAPAGEGRYRLGSLGEDRRTGGEGPAADLFHDPDASVDSGGVTLDELRPRLVASFADEASARALAEAWGAASEEAGLEIAVEGARLAIGAAGEARLEVQLAGEELSLAASGRLARGQAHFGERRGTIVLEGFSELWGEITGMLPAELATFQALFTAGGDFVGPFVSIPLSDGAWRVQLVEGTFVTEHFQPGAGAHAIGSVPIDGSALQLLPPDIQVAWAVGIDHDLLVRSMGQALGLDEEDALHAFEVQYGFRPDVDLVEPLGSELAFGLRARTSFVDAIDVWGAVRLEEPERFLRALRSSVELLENELRVALDRDLRTGSGDYRDVPYFTFALAVEQPAALGGLPIGSSNAVEITIAVLEDRLLVTRSLRSLKEEIRRLHPRLRRDSEEAPAAQVAPAAPPGAIAFGFADWSAYFGNVYDSARALVPLFTGFGLELPFDATLLPPASRMTRHFGPSTRWKRAVQGGTLKHTEGRIGPEVVLLGLQAALVGERLAELFGASSPGQARVEQRAVPAPVEEGPDLEAETRATLERLHVAIGVYRQDQGAAPETLAALAEGTEAFPGGFLGGEPLPADGWGRALHYARTAGGYRLWSAGPDGIDQDGEGDDVELPRGAGR